ncbi:MAG: hypothetical protein U0350_17845 [Caldilineaceae bacterium]
MEDFFVKWFADYLDEEEKAVRILLQDKSALSFLMTWSIFETICFGNYMKYKDVQEFPKRVIAKAGFARHMFDEAITHFHSRYQDKQLYKNLIFEARNDSEDVKTMLNKNLSQVSDNEGICLLTFVVYRYRNNIFHGNKGVSSWLQFTTEINLCSKSMQNFIDLLK